MMKDIAIRIKYNIAAATGEITLDRREWERASERERRKLLLGVALECGKVEVEDYSEVQDNPG